MNFLSVKKITVLLMAAGVLTITMNAQATQPDTLSSSQPSNQEANKEKNSNEKETAATQPSLEEPITPAKDSNLQPGGQESKTEDEGQAAAVQGDLPNTPTGLIAQPLNAVSVSLKWEEPKNNSGLSYEIYQNGALIGETSGLSYTVERLAGGGNYSFTLKAKNQFGASAMTKAAAVHSYGELLQNGSFSDFQAGDSTASHWTFEQDQPSGALPLVNDAQPELSWKQRIVVTDLQEGNQVRLWQEASVAGKQPYSWNAEHVLLSSGVLADWEVLFLDADHKLIDKKTLENPETKKVAQKGETPPNTAYVRVQLVLGGKTGAGDVVDVRKASFNILNESTQPPVKQPSGPTTYKYTYDANGRLTRVDTERGKLKFGYDANGNLLTKTSEGVIKTPAPQPPIEEEEPVQEALPELGELRGGGTFTLYGKENKVYTQGVRLAFKGWYLSEKEVEKIEYYWNEEKLLGETAYGLSDETTYFNYPQYQNHAPGFKFTLDLGSLFETLEKGDYKVTAVIHHKDGTTHTLETTLHIEVLNPNS
ncbi:hypothetical protein QWJ34_19220 [Saccharibacillus sp. CPCC 101409]|uniref:hypothetical protein n=1 Tax=Saccharibacillus sp. CPCC 101409 TaxID=3058041 RepID=UPI002673B762|nr:hypothetical protein [Saccharibacillus sp. CPCC 101409]MDO3411902.1 hypothetical protein [Saccharibacillus sp. CPCC 101409]